MTSTSFNGIFGLAPIKAEGTTVIKTGWGYYYVSEKDIERAKKLNQPHNKSWEDRRTKGWKWLWKKAVKSTREEVESSA